MHNNANNLRIYGDIVYVFKNNILITLYRIDKRFFGKIQDFLKGEDVKELELFSERDEKYVKRDLICLSGEIETVNARELHFRLNSKQEFSNWIKNRIVKYDFVQGIDFTIDKIIIGKATQFDYYISLDMAKELSMVENNEAGKNMRRYFIDKEKRARDLEKQIALPNFSNPVEAARAWADEVEQKQIAELKVKELEPKAEFYDRVTDTTDTVDMAEVAQLLNIPKMGRNNLFKRLRELNILRANNSPYQNFVDREYFKVIEVETSGGIQLKTLVYQKGLDFIRKRVS